MQLIKNKIRNQTSRLLTSSSLLLLLLNGNSGGCFRGLSSSNQNAIKPDPITIKPDQKEIKPTITSAPIVASSTPAVEKPVVHNQQQQDPNPNEYTPVVSSYNSGSSESCAPLLVDHGVLDLGNTGEGVTIDNQPIQSGGNSSDASVVSDTETVPFLVKVNECDALPKANGPEGVANDLPKPDNVQGNTFDDPNQLDANGDDFNNPEENIYENLEEYNQNGEAFYESPIQEGSSDEVDRLSKMGNHIRPVLPKEEATNPVQIKLVAPDLSFNAHAVDTRMQCIKEFNLVETLERIETGVNKLVSMREGNDKILSKDHKERLRKLKIAIKELIFQVKDFYDEINKKIHANLETLPEMEKAFCPEAENIKENLNVCLSTVEGLQKNIDNKRNGFLGKVKKGVSKTKNRVFSKSSKTNLK